uniref:Uncharacterized protein n=1 Tax=viral metagenome TaxID=1070528 RepID=A0A6H1ZNL0_9ZZZZ
MTARSTRNKMRWQAEMVMKDIDKAQWHLQLLTALTMGMSEDIEGKVANLVTLFEMMKATVKTFREGL